MLNAEWLRSYDTLRVIARRNDEAIQSKSFGNEQKADPMGLAFFCFITQIIGNIFMFCQLFVFLPR